MSFLDSMLIYWSIEIHNVQVLRLVYAISKLIIIIRKIFLYPKDKVSKIYSCIPHAISNRTTRDINEPHDMIITVSVKKETDCLKYFISSVTKIVISFASFVSLFIEYKWNQRRFIKYLENRKLFPFLAVYSWTEGSK